MAIYTRTGDDGTTALYGGVRQLKSDVQIEAYGSVDELTSVLGVFASYIDDKKERSFIEDIQHDLYEIMSFLAGAPTHLSKQETKIKTLEKKIDLLSNKLPPLKNFILPSGSRVSCWAHVARTVCRRSERAIVLSFSKKQIGKKKGVDTILIYMNRLSDLLFTYARAFNKEREISIKNE